MAQHNWAHFYTSGPTAWLSELVKQKEYN